MAHPPTRSLQLSVDCWIGSRTLASFLLLLLLLLLGTDADAEVRSSQHWALFNTVCARCHEAQCSGRLSLGPGDTQSRTHVERYAGRLSDDLHQQLVVYLQHMKEFCGFTAISLAFEPRSAWSEEQLTDFRTPNGEAYFVPLGKLEAENYRVFGRVTGTGWSAQIVSAGFEELAESGPCGKGDEFSLEFRADGGMYYLRVVGRGALHLQELRLAAISPPH